MKFSFFKSLYQPLPLEDEEPEEPVRNKEPEKPEIKPERPAVDMEALPEEEYFGLLSSDTLPGDFLDGIVEMINSGLPDFVRSCIDVEAEKIQVYTQLKGPLDVYLKKVVAQVKSDGAMSLQRQQSQLQDAAECLNKRIHELEKERDEIQRLQLSTERQKRTLTERTHELENRVSTLETEKGKIDETRRQINEQLRKANIRLEQLTSESENWSGLQSQLAEANGRIEMYAVAEEQYQRKMTELLGEKESWEGARGQWSSDLLSKEEERSAAVGRVLELEAELSRVATGESETLKEIEMRLAESQRLFEIKVLKENELTVSLREKSEEQDRLTKRIEELEQVQERLNGADQQQSAELIAVRTERDELARLLEKMGQEGENNDATVRKLTEETDRLSRQITDFQTAGKETKYRLSELEQALIDASHENESLEESVRTLKKQLSEVQSDRSAGDSLQNENGVLSGQVAQLQSLLSDMQSALENRSRECEDMDRELKLSQKEVQEFRKNDAGKSKQQEEELIRLKHELQVTTDICNAVKVQRKDLLADYEKVQREKENLQKELVHLKGDSRQVRDQKEELQAEVKVLKKQTSVRPEKKTKENEELPVEEDVLDWLVPTRLETPEEREARFEVERQLQREQEQREREQREKERERMKNGSVGQMSLW